jgi:hypothetical protein
MKLPPMTAFQRANGYEVPQAKFQTKFQTKLQARLQKPDLRRKSPGESDRGLNGKLVVKISATD